MYGGRHRKKVLHRASDNATLTVGRQPRNEGTPLNHIYWGPLLGAWCLSLEDLGAGSEEVLSGLSRELFRRSLYPISNARSLGVVQERTFRCPTSSD